MSRPADLTRAAAMACRVLLARRVDVLPVEPLALLRACRDTRVYTLDAAADETELPRERLERLFRDSDAVTFRAPEEGNVHYIVVYRLDGHPARLRFTLAHELGHRLLGHTGADPAEERETDCFASHLLCPEPVLRAVKELGGADAAERLATACYVSVSCARMALRREAVPVDGALLAAVDDLLAPAIARLESCCPKAE